MRIPEGIHYELMKDVAPAIALLGKPAVAHGVGVVIIFDSQVQLTPS